MSTHSRSTEPPPIPGRTLDPPGIGAQLARYRQLGQHATSVERLVGEVLVRFAEDLPVGLLERTLEVERRCCPFVHADYDPRERRLTITLENVDQAPRLDSLVHALTSPNATDTNN
jgi:hypothetical protein